MRGLGHRIHAPPFRTTDHAWRGLPRPCSDPMSSATPPRLVTTDMALRLPAVKSGWLMADGGPWPASEVFLALLDAASWRRGETIVPLGSQAQRADSDTQQPSMAGLAIIFVDRGAPARNASRRIMSGRPPTPLGGSIVAVVGSRRLRSTQPDNDRDRSDIDPQQVEFTRHLAQLLPPAGKVLRDVDGHRCAAGHPARAVEEGLRLHPFQARPGGIALRTSFP